MAIVDYLDRNKALKKRKGPWMQHWQDLAEVMHPRRADFTAFTVEGEQRTERIYDGTPGLARRGLSSAVDGLLKPKTSKWATMRPIDEDLEDNGDVKAWIEEAERRHLAALYNAKAHFIKSSREVDDDLVTFGTGILYMGESKAKRRLLFKSVHLKYCCPAENADGTIDTMYAEWNMTCRAAVQKWGVENVGKKTRDCYAGTGGETKDPDRIFTFLQCVQPRNDRDPRRKGNMNMPFQNVIIDVESEHIVEETGYHEFPFAVPRWDTASGELFGRSPGMLALADANTLQAQGKTILVTGQKIADPPWMMPSDSVLEETLSLPGGINYYDIEAFEGVGGNPKNAIFSMTPEANLPIAREMQMDTRDQIYAAFFRPVLQLPTDNPNMTATEVLERKDEFIRTIGPTFGQLESDYIAPIVERTFNIMYRGGAFPPVPKVLKQSGGVRFEYASPVERARKQVEAAGFARNMEIIAPIIEMQPEVADNFDGDEMLRDGPDIFGWPQRWLRPAEQVQGLREQRSQAMETQETIQQVKEAGEAANEAIPAIEQVT